MDSANIQLNEIICNQEQFIQHERYEPSPAECTTHRSTEPEGEEQYDVQSANIHLHEVICDQEQFVQNGCHEPSPVDCLTNLQLHSYVNLNTSPTTYSSNILSALEEHYFLNPCHVETLVSPLPQTIYLLPQHTSTYVPNIYATQGEQHVDQSTAQHPNFAPSDFQMCAIQQSVPQDFPHHQFIGHGTSREMHQEMISENWSPCQYPTQFLQQPFPQMYQNHGAFSPWLTTQVQPRQAIPSSLDPSLTGRSETVRFTSFQRRVLEKEFQINHYPTSSKFIEIGHSLNLSERQTERWFKKRRAKHKRESMDPGSMNFKSSVMKSECVPSEKAPAQSTQQPSSNGDSSSNQQHESLNNSSNSLDPSMKKTQKFSYFTYDQMTKLEQGFCINCNPTSVEITVIAQALELTERQVINWFKRRRAKLRKENITSSISMASAQTTSNIFIAQDRLTFDNFAVESLGFSLDFSLS